MINKFLGSDALKNHCNLPASFRFWVFEVEICGQKLSRSFPLLELGCYTGSVLMTALSHWSDPRREMEIEQVIELA